MDTASAPARTRCRAPTLLTAALLLAAVAATPGAAAYAGPLVLAAESAPIGFGAGTTGGAAGAMVTVTTYAQLVAEAKAADPRVIRVNGLIQGAQETVYVTSNKTIVGVGSGSGLVGGGFFVKKASNVIIRNLRISLARAPVDLIQIQKSDHVWVDHNELFNDTAHDKDYYDGLLDINHGSDLITVSWNRLHDHFKGSLVGHSDKNAAEDTGKLRVTYSHNWFEGVQARLPRVRFGTVHSYNNFFSNAVTSGIHCLMGAQCLVQNNVFRNVTLPIWTTEDSPVDGYAVQNGNDLGGAQPVITRTGTFTRPPYAVTMEPASSVEATVKAGAGTGKVG
jgi:pectate lyase